MSVSIDLQPILHKTICQDCAFYVKLDCTHPDELDVNCATVNFCSSFTFKRTCVEIAISAIFLCLFNS
ncbi:MAG: hypothetical protein HGA42_05275 [Nostocales cyanobacterium W4_Combined_metabat2_030]|nr:hypothetical protein [Nostocales cyanobacterium W4_Combined_metabat2_030]